MEITIMDEPKRGQPPLKIRSTNHHNSNILQFRSLQVVFLPQSHPKQPPFPFIISCRVILFPFFKSPSSTPNCSAKIFQKCFHLYTPAIADVESFVLLGYGSTAPQISCSAIKSASEQSEYSFPRSFNAGESQWGPFVLADRGVDAEGSDDVHQSCTEKSRGLSRPGFSSSMIGCPRDVEHVLNLSGLTAWIARLPRRKYRMDIGLGGRRSRGVLRGEDAENLPGPRRACRREGGFGEAVADVPVTRRLEPRSVRGASATPPRNACISGETRRGFMIPRTGLFFVSDAGFEEAAKLTVRAGCRLAKGGAASLTEDGDTDGFNNVAVSPVTKPENIPKDRAIMPELWIG
nr:hypothetical protein Iba_chr06bCG3860 [Ipomoea batatas]